MCSSREVTWHRNMRVHCIPRIGVHPGGDVEEYERGFSFLHLCIYSVWSDFLSWGGGFEDGIHLALKGSERVLVLDGVTCSSVDWVLERIIAVFFFRSVP